ncbi:MAG: hypothetical protein CMN76_00165 [Spirochaetaceae bacterium]|nr:hypothetical protein [Spirochaetaceae bacterium]|tara:strand:+ start:511 stop:813 length:303 start_codon:yes stop_codon:yes gene_type:complete
MAKRSIKENHDYTFKAKDFYELLDGQQERCALTGRQLTPENCTAIHRIPLRRGGTHDLNNICLVVEEIAQLKRSLLDDELYSLCEDLLQYRDRMDDQSKP